MYNIFVFLVLLSVTIFMSETSKVPPKPPRSIDPNCYSPRSSLDCYSRASLFPKPSDAVKSLEGEFTHCGPTQLEGLVSTVIRRG